MKYGRSLDLRRAAADELARMYYEEIYRYVYRQMGGKDEAMDVTQEIFITAFRFIDSYDSAKSGFRTWLYRVATNKIIDEKRRSLAAAGLRANTADIADAADIPAIEGDIAMRMDDDELLARIESYVSAMGEQPQQIYRMRIYADLSFEEIASQTHLPVATVKTKFYRLMKAIREDFGNAYHHAE
jgi:RNA polymerase sigma-70 factor (ECF subfamily)